MADESLVELCCRCPYTFDAIAYLDKYPELVFLDDIPNILWTGDSKVDVVRYLAGTLDNSHVNTELIEDEIQSIVASMGPMQVAPLMSYKCVIEAFIRKIIDTDSGNSIKIGLQVLTYGVLLHFKNAPAIIVPFVEVMIDITSLEERSAVIKQLLEGYTHSTSLYPTLIGRVADRNFIMSMSHEDLRKNLSKILESALEKSEQRCTEILDVLVDTEYTKTSILNILYTTMSNDKLRRIAIIIHSHPVLGSQIIEIRHLRNRIEKLLNENV